VALLRVVGVAVEYGDVRALDDLSLDVEEGQLVALLGPSGSGKSTLLNAVAGFIELRAGEIWLRGTVVSRPGRSLAPERRHVGVVFQSYALWPHMTVLETVAYPFRQRGLRGPDARERGRDLLHRVGLLELASRYPGQLSGGQQQRVGLARALAVEPQLFLFDEPTANLDPGLRAAMQADLRRTQQDTGAGGLYVTHDPGEALAIADHVAVMRAGRLVQQGPPQRVYTCPEDEWVATLTGPASILDGHIVGADVVGFAGTPRMRCTVHAARLPQPGPARLCVRPEWVALSNGSIEVAPATVAALRFQGPHTDYQLETPAGMLLARQAGPPRHAVGTSVGWRLDAVAVV